MSNLEHIAPIRTPVPLIGSQTSPLIGASPAMRRVADEIRMVADRKCNVLIEGETGTGKEIVARAIHESGVRSRGPWVAVNVGAIPESLLESELFGHTRGAFTGAVQSRAGKFEAANRGTIFLDEIGEMPRPVQPKLLRVLQEREIERLGGNQRVQLDVRVIAATNAGLAGLVQSGAFREDLFHRLNVFRIALPSLRERSSDIPMLIRYFIEKACHNERCAPKAVDAGALDKLLAYSWPGNVRELENVLESAVIVNGTKSVITSEDIRLTSTYAKQENDHFSFRGMIGDGGLDCQSEVEKFELSILTQALRKTRGNKTAAAHLLGMKRTTLAAKLAVLEARMLHLVA
jgi:two-component system, NtrC family, response regulator AtoC